MLRSIFTSVSLAVLLNALIKPLWLLTENVVHDQLGHEEWGIYTTLFSFAFLFISLSDLGINQYATKRLSEDPKLFNTYYPNFLSVKLLLNIGYPILMLGIGWLWGFRGRALYILGIVSLIHSGGQLVHFFRAQFQAKQKFKLDAVISVVDKALLLIVVLVLLATHIDLERFIWTRFLILLGLATLLFVGLSNQYGWYTPKWESGLIKKMLKASASFALITILYSIHDKVDQVMLQKIVGEVETSLYAGAYRWMDASSMYLWIILPIFFSKFAFHKSEPHLKNQLIRLGQLITSIPIVYLSVFVFFYGEKLLFLFANSTEAQLQTMEITLKVLFIALMVNGLVMIYSTLLTSTGHEKFVNKMILIGIAVNVLMNLILMPEYGAVGAAWSTVASLSLMGISYLWYTYYHLEEKVMFDIIGKVLIAMFILVAGFYILERLTLPWYVTSIFAGIGYLIACWSMKLLPRNMEVLKK